MTKEQIIALIDAKIAGQGTAVDASSSLPSILKGILDLIGGGGGTSDAVQYVPQTLTEAQQMQARKNQGLYYEETTEGEKTVTTPDSPDAKWPYPQENSIPYGDDYFRRITDDAPAQADIIEMIISGETTVAGSDLQSFDITGLVDFPSTVQGYSANPFVSSRQMFIVVSEDTVVDGNTYKKGIYVPHIELFANPYVSEITYNGETTTVHQIPAKYIPNTGLDVFEIKVSQDILYGEPLEVENVTYQDIMDACAAGKYIVLTIMADDDIGVRGRCLGGNFSRMENTGDSIYGRPCYCFAGAYRKASSESSGQFGGYSLKDVVLYEDANDGLLYVELQDCNG